MNLQSDNAQHILYMLSKVAAEPCSSLWEWVDNKPKRNVFVVFEQTSASLQFLKPPVPPEGTLEHTQEVTWGMACRQAYFFCGFEAFSACFFLAGSPTSVTY